MCGCWAISCHLLSPPNVTFCVPTLGYWLHCDVRLDVDRQGTVLCSTDLGWARLRCVEPDVMEWLHRSVRTPTSTAADASTAKIDDALKGRAIPCSMRKRKTELDIAGCWSRKRSGSIWATGASS